MADATPQRGNTAKQLPFTSNYREREHGGQSPLRQEGADQPRVSKGIAGMAKQMIANTKRDRDRQTVRQTDRQTDSQRDEDRETDRDRERLKRSKPAAPTTIKGITAYAAPTTIKGITA